MSAMRKYAAVPLASALLCGCVATGNDFMTRAHKGNEYRWIADITAAPLTVVPLAGELARRDIAPADFTVIRPSLEDAVISLLNGGSR